MTSKQTAVEETHISFTDGPGKHDLETAMFHTSGVGLSNQKKLLFTTQDGTKMGFLLLSIGFEDGSGESWLLKGYLTFETRQEVRGATLFADGYWNTRDRQGFLKVLKP